MKKVRRTGTYAEMELRRALHARGLRYRVDASVLSDKRRRVDIAFISARVAVFVDGCFWKAPVSRSIPSESHGFVGAATVAVLTYAWRNEPVGRVQPGVGAPFVSLHRSAKRAGGSIPSAECGCSVL